MRCKKNVRNYFIFMILICLTRFHYAFSQCSEEEWECDNGQCILDDDKCDGKVNCNDRSDEIAENCIQLYDTCQSYTFKCSYGACVAKTAKCNRRQDCADNSDELVCLETNESALQGRCSEEEMQCVKSRECISSNNICDGHKDCSDGSDETVELCIAYGCRGVGFQCGYGACINGNAKCNGTIECADGSDEAWELCNYPRKKSNRVTPTPTRPVTHTVSPPVTQPTNSLKCQIPNNKQTADLLFKLHPFNDTVQPGSFIEDFETLHVECKNGFSLRGQSSLLCENGKFNIALNRFPTCYSFCDRSQIQTLSTRAVCNINSHNAGPCPEKIRPNTEIKINCAYGYTRSTNDQQFIKCLSNGNFDKTREACVQECGRVSPSSQILSKGGITIKPSDAPWHVGIYEDTSVQFQYLCSGSIVSSRIIITAAHCFWDDANRLLKNSKFQIIAGKSTKNYTTIQGETPQIMDVEQIYIPQRYAGRGGQHRKDIAVVKLKTPLEYNESSSPICIPTEFPNDASNYVETGLEGFITAFGVNQLERLQMLTLAYHDCKNRSPVDTPLATDKFCIHNSEGAFVCRGDSGGGFVTTTVDSDGNIYNLFGVISYTPSTINDCTRDDKDSYVAVTSIRYITPDIRDILLNALKEDTILF